MDYGWAIKEMAASNIFPGDLFFKNFGVTAYDRVVFYDYDELTLLTECRFRKIPKPETRDEEMSDEPWFPVHDNDVFPEEFRTYLQFPAHVRKAFEKTHGDLFDVSFWQDMQKRIQSNTPIHVLPYKKHCRFKNRLPSSALYFLHKG